MPKNVYVIAGPNGAGKTTFAREFLPNYVHCPNFVNADLIAQGVSPFAPEDAAIRAGRLMLAEIHRLAATGADFAFETTLSGHTQLALWNRLKSQGYKVSIFGSKAQPWPRLVSAFACKKAVTTSQRKPSAGDFPVRSRISLGSTGMWQTSGCS